MSLDRGRGRMRVALTFRYQVEQEGRDDEDGYSFLCWRETESLPHFIEFETAALFNHEYFCVPLLRNGGVRGARLFVLDDLQAEPPVEASSWLSLSCQRSFDFVQETVPFALIVTHVVRVVFWPRALRAALVLPSLRFTAVDVAAILSYCCNIVRVASASWMRLQTPQIRVYLS